MVLESRFFNGREKDVSTVLSHVASHYRMSQRAGKNKFQWQLRHFDKAQQEYRFSKVSLLHQGREAFCEIVATPLP
jgi:hypothetical protein